MKTQPWTWGNSVVGFDWARRRLWLGGQRMHHGLTGSMLAGLGLVGLAAQRLRIRSGLQWTLVGTMLMAHDWKDRSVWFQLGPGDQE